MLWKGKEEHENVRGIDADSARLSHSDSLTGIEGLGSAGALSGGGCSQGGSHDGLSVCVSEEVVVVDGGERESVVVLKTKKCMRN